MSNADHQRLFFALWPDEPLRDSLATLTTKLGRKYKKPVASANLHMTLVFLGAVSTEQRVCMEKVAESLRIEPFTLSLDRAGYWPRPRILWVGCTHMPKELLTLVFQLSGKLQSCGYQPERRPYQAHVTLARKVNPPNQDLMQHLIAEFLQWHVRDFCLVQSETDPQGPRYRVLKTWNLI